MESALRAPNTMGRTGKYYTGQQSGFAIRIVCGMLSVFSAARIRDESCFNVVGLLQEIRFQVNYLVIEDRLSSIAGYQQKLDLRPESSHLPGEFHLHSCEGF